MLRPRFPGAALILAVVVFAAPAWAHPGLPVSDLAATQMLPAPEFPPAMLSAAPETPGLPWPVVMIALLTLAACWRRPRRALVLALALVLAVFAFQNGLHSAHHAADHHHAVTCPVASASAQLSATPVDLDPNPDVILTAAGHALERATAAPISRPLCPDQGRAPPSFSA